MNRFLLVLSLLAITLPANADVATSFDSIMPDEIRRIPFYTALFIIAIITFISIRNDLKRIEQEKLQEEQETESQ